MNAICVFILDEVKFNCYPKKKVGEDNITTERLRFSYAAPRPAHTICRQYKQLLRKCLEILAVTPSAAQSWPRIFSLNALLKLSNKNMCVSAIVTWQDLIIY